MTKRDPKAADRISKAVSAILSWRTFATHVRYLPSSGQKKIQEAFELGMELHKNQQRRSGDPYFTHPVAVANILADMHADADTIIAALLHDALEDTDLSEDELHERFGSSVRNIVVALTKLEEADVADQPSLDEQIETLRKLFTAMEQDARIMLIKIVDRLHNMQTVSFLSPEKQLTLAKETADVYVKIADRLSLSDLRDELAELSVAVLQPELWERLLELRIKNEKRGHRIIERMRSTLEAADPAHRDSVMTQYEQKTLQRLRAQHEAGGSAATGVSSITAVFVCDSVPVCYEVLGVLHQTWRRESLSFQDYINSPKVNGYQGLHTTIILEDGTRVRCKIRTRRMQEYARRGIGTKCFDRKAKGLFEYMPWTKRIATLAEDTVNQSDEFWETLQNDILGEAIVVHLPDDRTVMLPDGSTALDGAFYGFSNHALKLKSIQVNGEDVSFQEPLENGVSLSVELGKQKTVEREWLQWAKTGIASALIHSALAEQPKAKKIAQGRSLLESVMIERRKGLLAEFEEESFHPGLSSIGYHSLDDALIGIAEGHREPSDIYRVLFEPSEFQNGLLKNGNSNGSENGADRRHYMLRFTLPKNDVMSLRRLLDVYEQFGDKMGAIRVLPIPFSSVRRFSVSAKMTEEEAEEWKKRVNVVVKQNVSFLDSHARFWTISAVPLLVLLWGLDCLFGKRLIAVGVAPIDLTILRFAALFVYSLCHLFLHRNSTEEVVKKKWIPILNTDLFFSGATIFLTAVFSYIAVQHISALAYALCMNAAVVLLFVLTSKKNVASYSPVFVTSAICLVLLPLLLLFDETKSLLSVGAVAGVAACASFMCYSVASARYQSRESIRSRYPVFILCFSLLSFLLSMTLLPFTTLELFTSSLLLPSIVFVVLLTIPPYFIYFEMMKLKGIVETNRFLPLFISVVALGEFFVFQNRSWFLLVPILLSGLWVITYRSQSAKQSS